MWKFKVIYWYGSKKLEPAWTVMGNKSAHVLKENQILWICPSSPFLLLNSSLSCSYWHELVNFWWIEIYVLIPATLKNTVYLPGTQSALNCRLMPQITSVPFCLCSCASGKCRVSWRCLNLFVVCVWMMHFICIFYVLLWQNKLCLWKGKLCSCSFCVVGRFRMKDMFFLQ